MAVPVVLDFGVQIWIDGVARSETPLTPALPPTHPDNPTPVRNVRYTASASELRLTWEAPTSWGNEDSPTGVPRHYIVRYRTDHTPDDQQGEPAAAAYNVPANGADRIVLLGITAENAAGRRSHELLLPVPIHFRVYSRKYGPAYGPAYS